MLLILFGLVFSARRMVRSRGSNSHHLRRVRRTVYPITKYLQAPEVKEGKNEEEENKFIQVGTVHRPLKYQTLSIEENSDVPPITDFIPNEVLAAPRG